MVHLQDAEILVEDGRGGPRLFIVLPDPMRVAQHFGDGPWGFRVRWGDTGNEDVFRFLAVVRGEAIFERCPATSDGPDPKSLPVAALPARRRRDD